LEYDLIDNILRVDAQRGFGPLALRLLFVYQFVAQLSEDDIDPEMLPRPEEEVPATSPVPADMPVSSGSGERSEEVNVS